MAPIRGASISGPSTSRLQYLRCMIGLSGEAGDRLHLTVWGMAELMDHISAIPFLHSRYLGAIMPQQSIDKSRSEVMGGTIGTWE